MLASLQESYPQHMDDTTLLVDIRSQRLLLVEKGKIAREYPVSTSRYGIGSQQGSNKTPTGAHRIARKIGSGAAPLTIFKGRKNTGRIAAVESRPRSTGDDFVTTRILWLKGLEPGQNLGDGVDSYNRYIYIHGTHEEGLIGQPASHGCIRMRNDDVIDLYDRVSRGAVVYISEDLTSREQAS